jgi:hypothetical protein
MSILQINFSFFLQENDLFKVHIPAHFRITDIRRMIVRENEHRIHNQIQKRLSAGEKANILIKEQSPYLLQHAFNPVDWHPWDEDAFSIAQKEDKPIFLSIGYSTCHWCHVMAHESFEDPEIAAILNRWFVSVKVDREERPDIDQMYMAAIHAMSGSGGWPMSVFLMPDGSPFYAGTYFPPISISSHPSFKELLMAINTTWLEQKDRLQDSANKMIAVLETDNRATPDIIKADALDRCYRMLEENYDSSEGGFGPEPKFPRPAILSFLLSYYLATGRENARDMALYTLRKMASGGMYDQLGGGFHRYSVDAHWFVPHFEKMLYDQAQLAHSYLSAYQISKDDVFARITTEIFTYLLRDMRDPAGGFYSAEDADSDNPYNPGQHGEGAFYLWTREDIFNKLDTPEAANIFTDRYGVKAKGNVQRDPLMEFSGRNILHYAESKEEVAARYEINREKVEKSLTISKDLLFQARQQRRRPHLDDKIITSWNGMMIGALARGSRILHNELFLTAAIQTATFIEENLYDNATHSLLRRYRNQEAGITGQLTDYTYLVEGLLDLYQANHSPKWLKWSANLTARQIKLFWNEDEGFFFDSVADPSIKIRIRDKYDGAEPTGNSVAAQNLQRLAQLLNKPEWLQMARRLVESFSEVINHYPPALPLMLKAWQNINNKPCQVVVAGEKSAGDTEALLRVVEGTVKSPDILLLADGADNQAYLAERLPFINTVVRLEGKATAYLCFDFTCQLPTTDPAVLQTQLEEAKIAG